MFLNVHFRFHYIERCRRSYQLGNCRLGEIWRCFAQALVLGKYGDVCVSPMNLITASLFGQNMGLLSNFKFALLEHYSTRIRIGRLHLLALQY